MAFDPIKIVLESGEFPPLYKALNIDRDFKWAGKLIASGDSLDDLIEDSGGSLLHYAVKSGDKELVEFFLYYDCSKILEHINEMEETPLILAVKHNYVDMVVSILAAKANPNTYDESNVGNTAIKEAVKNGCDEIVDILLRAGADPTIPGWMNISAVDQAWIDIRADRKTMRKIRSMLIGFPSSVRSRIFKQNKTVHINPLPDE